MQIKNILIAVLLLAAGTAFAQSTSALTSEERMERLGLVRLCEVDSTIRVRLVFATADNFTGRRVYEDIRHAYLHPEAAQALQKAQASLKRMHPELSLVVLDAARPLAEQAKLYRKVAGKLTNIYVSDPRNGGDPHNYGLAVDVTLCRESDGELLPMGTRYCDFVPASGQAAEEAGTLDAESMKNRQLLRSAMVAGGFKTLRTEWWHFNFRTRSEARANFRIIH